MPTLPTMPASVIVSTRRPSAWSIRHTIQHPARSLCQSHVWMPIGSPSAVALPRQATVEHSPRPAARISVRAFIAAITATSCPLPAAIPSISSPRSGAQPWITSMADPPSRRISSGPIWAVCWNSRS